MKARMLEAEVAVRSPEDEVAPTITTLRKDDVFEVVETGDLFDGHEVRVAMAGGRRGVIAAGTRFAAMDWFTLRAAKAEVRGTPTVDGEVVATLRQGDRFDMADRVASDGAVWAHVLTKEAVHGYLPAGTEVYPSQARPRRFGRFLGRFGGILFAVGLMAGVLTVIAPPSQGYMAHVEQFEGQVLAGALEVTGLGLCLVGFITARLSRR
jgi:hypothetical protein